MLESVTEEDIKEAARAGKEAVDNALRGLPESVSMLMGYAVDVILENGNFRVEPAKKLVHPGYGTLIIR